MNRIILSHQSAIFALRQYQINKSWDDIILLLNSKRGIRIHTLNHPKTNQQNTSKNFKHKRPAKLPRNSILNINDELSCVKPEFSIIQMAPQLNYEKLSLLVMEFCGTYSVDVPNKSFKQTNQPLTNINKIKKYLKRYKELNPCGHGLKKLSKVLTSCQNFSASPMESRLYIKLCGSRKQGLYGCKGLQLNRTINISETSRIIAGQNTITPDICHLRHKVAIEYDSAQYHENTEQGQRDKRRRDALVNDGWKVISFVPQQVQNAYTFDPIARNILKCIKQDNRIRCKNFKLLRNQAFAELR